MPNPAVATVVYIVDDDDAVREGFARLLRSAGLEPRAYGCPETFLLEVAKNPGARTSEPGQPGKVMASGTQAPGLWATSSRNVYGPP